MKRMGKRVLGIIAVVLIYTMLMGMTVHAEIIPSSWGGLTISDIYGKVAAPITSPRTEYIHRIGYAYNYTITVTTSVSSKKKGILLNKSYETSVKTTVGGKTIDIPIRGVTIIPNKVGTATFTVNYSDSSGAWRSASQTIRCYKWSNPFNTLKIGKKSFKKAFKKTNAKTIAPVSGKLNIKMNGSYKKLKVYYAAKGKGLVKISKKAKVTLNSGDKLIFRFNDNKNRVRGEEAVLTVG